MNVCLSPPLPGLPTLSVLFALGDGSSNIIKNINIANAVKDPINDIGWRECRVGRDGDCS